MAGLSKKLKTLNAAVRALAGTDDIDQLMERMLDVVEQVFERETAAVLLCEAGGEHLKIVASRGYEPQVVSQYHARVGQGVAGSVAATGEPRLVTDVKAEPDYVPGVSAAVSEMAVPLTVDGNVIGVLDVESRESAFGEEDMSLLVSFGEQAGWALRHGQALAQAEERARRLELLNLAARALNAIVDPEEVLSRILELAKEALGFQNVAVLVIDRRDMNLEVRKALRPKEVEGLRIPVTQGVTGQVFTTGEPEIVADVTKDPRYIAGGMEGPRSEMVAPLKINGEIIGVLDAEAPGVEVYNPLDLEVFSAFAAQVATALRNAVLVQDLEDQARRLKAITRTGLALNTIHNADDLLEKILEAASEALDLDRAAILLYYAAQSELVIHAARGYGDVLGKRIPMGEGVTGRVAATVTPRLINDVTRDAKYIPGIQEGGSEMAVPLVVFDELYGVLDTESPAKDAFSQQDLALFQAFGAQAAVALYNARLFRRLEVANKRLKRNVEEMKRLNSELETYAAQITDANQHLETQIKQLTTLHQAGQAITSSLDLDATLKAILRMSEEIIQSSAGAIKLLDAETGGLRVAAQSGEYEEITDSLLKVDLPLKIGERKIGEFELIRAAHRRIGTGEQQMLETLASQAAIAIENARLFGDTQRVYYETLKSLAKALEARDDYTRGHSERVARMSRDVAQELGLDDDERNLIFNSALLHDIGKIGVRDAVLLKPRKLTEEEVEVIRQHPTFGNIILGPLKFLGSVAELVKYHHESYDGTGYPQGLKGEEIPLASRIIAVADAYDAMTSSRPYRAARSHEEALAEMKRVSGQQLDPMVLEAFFKVIARQGESAP